METEQNRRTDINRSWFQMYTSFRNTLKLGTKEMSKISKRKLQNENSLIFGHITNFGRYLRWPARLTPILTHKHKCMHVMNIINDINYIYDTGSKSIWVSNEALGFQDCCWPSSLFKKSLFHSPKWKYCDSRFFICIFRNFLFPTAPC